jgi:hypothetical protein
MYRTSPTAIFIGALSLGLFTSHSIANAQGSSDQSDLYGATESSLDLFGSAAVGQQTIDHLSGLKLNRDFRLGAGAGLNYFFTRNLGLAADAYTENIAHSFIDSASMSFIGRLPLGHSGFSPYLYGGFGRQFDASEVWFGQAGAGIEYRFTHQFGVFLDARYVIPDGTANYGLGRLGLRCRF